MKIGTIEQELNKCRAAFAAHPDATWAWCCHHEIHCEPLTEPAENRIEYILSEKSKSEQAVRLLNLRPCKDADAAAVALHACYTAVALARDADAAAVALARDPFAADAALTRDGYADPRKPADKTLRELHHAEWPNNTWTGTSIFSE